MLGVGIDWAEAFHLVALGQPDQGVIEVVRVDHRPAGVMALLGRISYLEPSCKRSRTPLTAIEASVPSGAVTAGGAVRRVAGSRLRV